MASHLRRVATIACVVLLIGGCGDSSTSTPSTSIAPTTTPAGSSSTSIAPSSSTTTVLPTTTVPVERTVVTTYFTREALLVAGSRSVPKADAIRAAVAAVVDGPNSAERAAGFASAIPSGSTLRGVVIDSRRADVDLTTAFTTGGGSLSMRMRVAQIVYTIVRNGAADTVRFLIDGRPVESIGGEGLIVTNVTIAEFDDLLPPIVVEFPTPGATVGQSFSFRGLANVFEGHVSYELLDARSAVLTKGFATGMMGAWGQFQTTITVPAGATRPLVLSVFTVSPKDGSRRDQSQISLTSA